MDTAVRTGITAAPRDVSLTSLSLESLAGERVCLLMEVTAPEKSAMAAMRECETVVQHALLDAEGAAAERLDGTLKELNGLLKGMLVSGAIQDVHMLVSVLDADGFLHVSHAGRAEAYLVRGSSVSQITELSGRPMPSFVHIASGKLEGGDAVLLSTQRLLRSMTPAQMQKSCKDRDMAVETLARALEADGEHAALASIDVPAMEADVPAPRAARPPLRRAPRRGAALSAGGIAGVLGKVPLPSAERVQSTVASMLRAAHAAARGIPARGSASGGAVQRAVASARAWMHTFLADLSHPERKKRAHLLLAAAALTALVVLWATVHLVTASQRSKTRAELEELVEQITVEIQTAENRSIVGDRDAANAILDRAEDRAKQVMEDDSGLFRTEANELIGRIRSKKEDINNIVRLTPRTVANIAANDAAMLAQGMVSLGDGEFLAYDRQNVYRVLLSSVEQGSRLSDDVLVVDGADFPRYQSQVFLMNGNSVVEWQGDRAVSMKTDDPSGWVSGVAIDAYLRYIYILSPESGRINKYERKTGSYGVPVNYNVNGDLTGAVDMAIDGNVYVLRHVTDESGVTHGSILKLFRGEEQPFVVRQAPEDILDHATKIVKVADRQIYVLDPEGSRVIVLSDGGATGESTYVRQYVLEGEQIGTLKDLAVDADETHLYVMDEKKLYVVDLATR